MRKTVIRMKSSADKVKGQGVLSAYLEQVDLVRSMSDHFEVLIDEPGRADITHYHTVDLTHYLEMPFVKLRGGKTVGYVHFLPETVDNSLKMPKLFKSVFYAYLIKFYAAMDALVTVNPYFIDLLVGYGIDRSKVTYIPNYVSDAQFYKMTEEEKLALRSQYGLEPDRFVVMGVGQLQTRKGVMDFVRIARDLPQITFVWAGGFSFGGMTDGYREIKQVVDNPPDNVKFLGIVDREAMNGLYNVADLMFLPSYAELFPMAILEAMSAGTPILLRNLDIYEDILFDFYLKADTIPGFEKIIRRLANDPAYYAEAVAMAGRGNTFYGRDHVAHMWRDFYDGVMMNTATAQRERAY